MLAATTTQAAASKTLAAEVTKKVRERGLVVWIDAEKQFSNLTDQLAGGAFGFTYPVVRFRGSYLELIVALEEFGSGLHPEKVLVHLAGLNKETVKETPVLELYKAGSVFEKSLQTLVREAAVGVARPDEVDAFLRGADVSLEAADAWLAEQSDRPREGIGLLLDALGLDEVVLGLIQGDPRISKELPQGSDALFAYLERGLGLSKAWRARWSNAEGPLGADAFAQLVGSFIMAVEFVHDLKEQPVMPELLQLTKLGAHAKKCRELAERARERSPGAYEVLANDLQEHFEQERKAHTAAALGSIDTFRFEEQIIRKDALEKLKAGEWDVAMIFSAGRTVEKCFWVRQSEPLQRTWEMMRLAAKVGMGIAKTDSALDKCASLEEAVERYTTRLAPVDRAHRIFEQRARTGIVSELEDYDALLAVRDAVRVAYRGWVDRINRAFFALCEKLGPLPPREMRQRAVYADVVQPAADRGRVAYFMVDAFRYEMAQALQAELERDKFRVTLRARLAELPTITDVGMNALAPVESGGRLRAAQSSDGSVIGFYAGSFRITEPAKRVEAIRQRSGDVIDLPIDDVVGMRLDQLKTRLKSKPNVVVVRSLELDNAGEVGLHLITFDHTLAQIKSAISLLSQVGIERFVIASDHGFLLQDTGVENVDFGASKRVPRRRHALLDQPSGMPGVLEVRLSALEYEVERDQYLVLRPDTAVWKTNETVAPFVHGGNSLQERVIPVLELEKATARGKTLAKYEVVARPEPAHLGRQRLVVSVRLRSRETKPMFFDPVISLALRVPERPDITVTLLDAHPPAKLSNGQLLVVPNQEEARVELELEGEFDEKVRVEIFHPEGKEDVSPKLIEGFFDVGRSRRLGKPRPGESSAPPGPEEPAAPPRVPTPQPFVPPRPPAPPPEWASLIEDAGFRQVLQIIEKNRIINEAELAQVLGSPRRVRSFSLEYDELVKRLPFEIEVTTASGMKAYKRRD